MSEVYPVASGFPEQSGIMIPEVWSRKVLAKFYQATWLSEITNNDYEGEIKNQGDTVHIRTTPDITISDHKMGEEFTYDSPQPTLVDLLIDKGKRYGFINDLIQQHQADYEYVETWTGDAGKQMAIAIERAFLADVYASAHANNKGLTAGKISAGFNLGAAGAPVALDKTNILDYVVDCKTVLDEGDVPAENRWMLLPAWASGLLAKSDLRDASFAGSEKSTLLQKGAQGMIGGFMIYESNLVSHVTDTYKVANIVFGQKHALTFASQLVLNEGPLKDVKVAGHHYRGLQVYGYKAAKTEALGHLYAYKG